MRAHFMPHAGTRLNPRSSVPSLPSPVAFHIRSVRSVPLVLLLLLSPGTIAGQSYFTNTDARRPFRVEDAAPLPRYALGLHAGPEWSGPGMGGRWMAIVGASYGLVPRTQIELDVPVVVRRTDGSGGADLSGVRLAAQHNLNIERRVLPAVAVEGAVLIAAGETQRSHPAIKGIATKTFRWARLSVNSEASFGDEPVGTTARASLSRWQTGLALDRAFVRSGALLGADIVAVQPMDPGLAIDWSAAVGGRYQMTSHVAFDTRVSRSLTGGARGWGVAAALSRFVPLPELLPGFGRWGSALR